MKSAFGCDVARVARGLFDQAQSAVAAAAEAGEMRQQPQRRRQRRHRVAVHADDQAGVLALGVELERALVLVIRAARRAEAAEHASFDRRGVRGQKSVRGADLIVRVGVGRMLAKPLLAERQRLTKSVVKRRRRARRSEPTRGRSARAWPR